MGDTLNGTVREFDEASGIGVIVSADDHADPLRLVELTDRAVHLNGRSC